MILAAELDKSKAKAPKYMHLDLERWMESNQSMIVV
jgi:hypothetical protein